MKISLAKTAIAAAAITATTLLAATPAMAQLRVTEAMSNALSNSSLDWFELTNYGSSAVSLTGYKMDDNSYSFAAAVAMSGVASIAPGESVVFVESTSSSVISAFRSYWSLASSVQVGSYSGSGVGLSASADAVTIFNAAGTEVDRFDFGAATSGVSFDASQPATATSPILLHGISVSGQFGAYTVAATATNTTANIGSPGFAAAVPEPSSYVLMLAGLSALAWTARRASKRG